MTYHAFCAVLKDFSQSCLIERLLMSVFILGMVECIPVEVLDRNKRSIPSHPDRPIPEFTIIIFTARQNDELFVYGIGCALQDPDTPWY